MAERIVSFVMSGGVGSRLWPLSREDNPKQFHDLSGDGSMLVKTLKRLAARPAGETPIFLIASEKHATRVHTDLAAVELSGGGAHLRAVGRNTAAAVAFATLHTLDRYGDGLVLVVPSDHEISTERQFWETIEAGAAAAQSTAGSSCSASSPASRRPASATSRSVGEGRSARRLALRREAGPRNGQSLSRLGQFLLEHRHLPVPRQRHARCLLRAQPGNLERRPRRRSKAASAEVSGPLLAGRPLCARSRRSRSTTRSWSGRAASPWPRPASAGTISAHGSRCSTSARPTRRATSSSATSSRSTARTRICAATAGCSRRSG